MLWEGKRANFIDHNLFREGPRSSLRNLSFTLAACVPKKGKRWAGIIKVNVKKNVGSSSLNSIIALVKSLANNFVDPNVHWPGDQAQRGAKGCVTHGSNLLRKHIHIGREWIHRIIFGLIYPHPPSWWLGPNERSECHVLDGESHVERVRDGEIERERESDKIA